jgi:hypothetical protein
VHMLGLRLLSVDSETGHPDQEENQKPRLTHGDSEAPESSGSCAKEGQ